MIGVGLAVVPGNAVGKRTAVHSAAQASTRAVVYKRAVNQHAPIGTTTVVRSVGRDGVSCQQTVEKLRSVNTTATSVASGASRIADQSAVVERAVTDSTAAILADVAYNQAVVHGDVGGATTDIALRPSVAHEYAVIDCSPRNTADRGTPVSTHDTVRQERYREGTVAAVASGSVPLDEAVTEEVAVKGTATLSLTVVAAHGAVDHAAMGATASAAVITRAARGLVVADQAVSSEASARQHTAPKTNKNCKVSHIMERLSIPLSPRNRLATAGGGREQRAR